LTAGPLPGDVGAMSVRLASVIGGLALLLVSSGAGADEDHAAGPARGLAQTEDGLAYTVASGDTLSEIAVRFDVSVDDLLRWNPDLSPDRIREGQRIRIENGLRRVTHTVQRGENLSHIAARWEVTVEEVLQWNRRLRRDHVRAGRELVIFTPIPESRSRSIGQPHEGQLVSARQLPRHHPSLYVRRPGRAWGTDETVRWIVEAYEALREADPSAPAIEVHDLSLRQGGPMHGHRSHESGRDADIAYFQNGCGDPCRFRRIGSEHLDVERQWRVFRHWLENGQVEAIFMDIRLQRVLYEHARERGVSRHDLSRWFQYPRDVDDRFGVIRHHPRHADHFHVRFICHDSDDECR